ncbi:uncharacterized protein LOC134273966 [Saccostrea cucullata]|uniref:uncharacterized protein LOC134273966 n=1 Tax=Saccostrea cuccullata TaxID=36930 RepID=UPI002ED1C876
MAGFLLMDIVIFFNMTATSWNKAKKLCQVNGAELIQVENYDEINWIKETFLSNSNQDECLQNCCGVWYKAPDIESGNFYPPFKSDISFENFKKLRSNNRPFTHCAIFCIDDHLDYDTCGARLAFICEKELSYN